MTTPAAGEGVTDNEEVHADRDVGKLGGSMSCARAVEATATSTGISSAPLAKRIGEQSFKGFSRWIASPTTVVVKVQCALTTTL
jgi:hypothetical protein